MTYNTNQETNYNTNHTNYTNYINHAEKNHLSNLTDLPTAESIKELVIEPSNFYDFNTAESLGSYNLIPSNTLAKVSLYIKRGGYNDPAKGWTDGYATQSKFTGAVYLACEFTITEGEYAGRKIWSNIGLYSNKNNNKWGDMGRSFIRSILNSSYGYSDKDQSEQAKAARGIKSFEELNDLEFIARISQVKDQNSNMQNVIKCAIDPEHKDYIEIMGIPGFSNITKPDWA